MVAFFEVKFTLRIWWILTNASPYAVHGVAKTQTQLSDFTFHFHALENEMATHSSVLAWRSPWTEKPGRLQSMGSHRVRHDWSDLAAACNSSPYLDIDCSHHLRGASCSSHIIAISERIALYPLTSLYTPQLKIPVSGPKSEGHLYVSSSRDAPFKRYDGKVGGEEEENLLLETILISLFNCSCMIAALRIFQSFRSFTARTTCMPVLLLLAQSGHFIQCKLLNLRSFSWCGLGLPCCVTVSNTAASVVTSE